MADPETPENSGYGTSLSAQPLEFFDDSPALFLAVGDPLGTVR